MKIYIYSIGNCSFRQFIPSKPGKYGLKFWSIVDVKSSYLLDTDIYIGKSTTNADRNQKVNYNL